MKLIIEWDGSQEPLGFDDNFDLVDTIIYMMDYGEGDVVHDSHNGMDMTLVRDSYTPEGEKDRSVLDLMDESWATFKAQAKEYIDREKEKQNEQD